MSGPIRRPPLRSASVALLCRVALAGCGSSSSAVRPGPATRRSRSTTASTSRPPTPWSPGSRRRPASTSTSATMTRTSSTTRSRPRGRARQPTSSTPRTPPRCSSCRTTTCSHRSTPSTLANTPKRFNSAKGDWVGVSARVSVLDYNPSLISASQLPKTALEMADPQYKGKLAIAPGETDFQPIVTSMIRRYGTAATKTWLEGLKANAGSSATPIPTTRRSPMRSTAARSRSV